MQLQIRQRVQGLDPDQFWQGSPGTETWRAMLAKYAALAEAARLASGPRGDNYKQALVELSRRWPGALREGELIGPERVAGRHRAAEAGLLEPDRHRGGWLEDAGAQTPAPAALCWAELHILIRDLLGYRRGRNERGKAPAPAFGEWLATANSQLAMRWPPRARVAEVIGPTLEVRSAYLCLAARAGLELPALHLVLFARTGRWDRRAEDPSWAHA